MKTEQKTTSEQIKETEADLNALKSQQKQLLSDLKITLQTLTEDEQGLLDIEANKEELKAILKEIEENQKEIIKARMWLGFLYAEEEIR